MWKSFPNGAYDSAQKYGLSGNMYDGTVAVEFIGPSYNTVKALNHVQYKIEKIIFYNN